MAGGPGFEPGYLVRGCCAGRIAGEPLLPGLKEVFRPAVIQILDDPFTTAQLGDALLAAQALQHNADLLFCRELPACRRRMSFTTFSAGSFTGISVSSSLLERLR